MRFRSFKPSFLWKRMKLLHKLLFIFCILIILPVIFIFVIFYTKMSSILENQILYSAQQSFDQAQVFLNYKLYNIYQTSSIFVSDASLNDILQRGEQENYPFLSQVEDMYRLNDFITSYEDGENIGKVELYVEDSLFYAQGNNRLYSFSDAQSQNWYPEVESEKIVWTTDVENSPESILLIRKIINSKHYADDIAIAKFCFSRSDIENILHNAVTLPEGSAYLINSQGNEICSSLENMSAAFPFTPEEIQTLDIKFGEWSQQTIGDSSVFLSVEPLQISDWRLVFIIPREAVLKERTNLLNSLIFITVIFLLSASIISYRLFRSITKRLSGLSVRMREVQTGVLTPIREDLDRDEIGSLIQDYNYMIGQIDSLIREKTQMVGELKNAELKALQAQINPHFLYNTLDMINWMVWNDSKQEILETVDSLANFYKISLSKGKDRISIREELQHVSYYHAIQNMRFDHRIQLIIQVDSEIQKQEIPKITLQPIVENSILHGIAEKAEKKGIIRITGKYSKESISLFIQDDGVGMPQSLIDKLGKEDLSEITSSGYGIRNINRRLKLCYGTEFGLFFTQSSEGGTTAEIRLPKLI